MASIYVVSLVHSNGLDVFLSFRCHDPVTRIFIRNHHTTTCERLGINPLYITIFPEFFEIVLQRPVAEVGALVSEVSIKSEPRERETTVYQESENPVFPLFLSHVTTIGGMVITSTESVIVSTYWKSFIVSGHIFRYGANYLYPPTNGLR